MVNHIGVGTQAPESANLMRHMRVLGDRLIPDQPFSEPKEPSPGVSGDSSSGHRSLGHP